MQHIVLEPLIHEVVSNGHRDQHRQRHQLYEVGREQRPETSNAGAKYFTHADLLCTLFSNKRSKTEKTQTRYKDRQTGEHRCEIADPRLCIKFLLILFV